MQCKIGHEERRKKNVGEEREKREILTELERNEERWERKKGVKLVDQKSKVGR